MNPVKFTAKLVRFLKKRYTPRGGRISFSQAGEDLIMQNAMDRIGINSPSYLDIGAHHPVFANNTYLFYINGGHGTIVEPNKALSEIAEKKRPHDKIIQAGAGRNDGEKTFYSFPQTTRSTFSEKQASEWEKSSGQKSMKENVKLFSLDTLIEKNFSQNGPDLVSIDAEGYDMEILSGYSFRLRPKVFCIETLEAGKRSGEIYRFFEKNNYFPYSETPANTIFADINIFHNKK